MMKVNCYYCNYKNFGDQLNKAIFKREINIKTGWAKYEDATLIGVGSIIEAIIERPMELRKKTSKKCICFSCGFADEEQIMKLINDSKEAHLLRPVEIKAVRGKKTLSILQKYNLIDINSKIVLADGGLLSCDLVNNHIEKEYDVGIVPHAAERKHQVFGFLKRMIPNSVIVDIRKNPISFLEEISKCKTIISTAMHPLIAADALGIPNLWIRLKENEAVTDRFKFDDYYSIYGVKKIPKSVYDVTNNIKHEVELQYNIPKEIVQAKQDELRQVLREIAEELIVRSKEINKEYYLNWFYVHIFYNPHHFFCRICNKIKRLLNINIDKFI